MKPGWHLINGTVRSEHSATFDVPPPRERNSIPVGGYAKIGVIQPNSLNRVNGERFWVRITARKPGPRRYTGTVEQADMLLHHRHGIENEQEIEFGPQHVLDVQ